MVTTKVHVNPDLLPGYTFNPAELLFTSDVELAEENDQLVIQWNGHSYRVTDLPNLQLVAYHNTDPDLVTTAARAGWDIRQLLRPMCAICGNDESSGVYQPGQVLCEVCLALPQAERVKRG